METKERIILESLDMFLKYGIRSVTMDRIAEKMGISKRTIYENFRDKDDLLLEGMLHLAAKQKAEVSEIIKQSANIIEVLFRLTARQANQMRGINPQFVYDFRKYHAAVYKTLTSRVELRDYGLTESFLKRGVEEGIFREEMNIDLVNRFLHILMDVFGPETDPAMKEFSHRDIFDHVFLAYIRGISTEKGITLIDKNRSIPFSSW